jgi:hypothetical protein
MKVTGGNVGSMPAMSTHASTMSTHASPNTSLCAGIDENNHGFTT